MRYFTTLFAVVVLGLLTVLGFALALSSCSRASGSTVPVKSTASVLHAVVTLYAPPDSTQWQSVEKAYPAQVRYAIIDACDAAGNGSGCNGKDWTSEPTGWANTISVLEEAHIVPLIYISTGYGKTSAATVEHELAQAKGWWGVAQPMFDEMAGNDPAYYKTLYNYSVDEGAGEVMYNPGTWYQVTSADYFGNREILQGYEGPETGVTHSAAPSWVSGLSPNQFSATISAGTAANVAGDLVNARKDDHAGLVYVDDEPEPPNYATLPKFWSIELIDLAKTPN